MIAEIVAIGTELLMGQIADSDAQMLSRELQSLGIAVYHHQVVGDNPQRMREALALAREIDLPMLKTPYTMFEACARLYSAGLRPVELG